MTIELDADHYPGRTDAVIVGDLTAADIMSSPVVAVSAHETLWEAWGLLYRSGFRHLVVVDGTKCIGVLDDRRIMNEWPLGPIAPHQRKVSDAVSRRNRIVVGTTPVRDVARIMLEERVDAVPIVNDRGDVLGLVTATDVLDVVARFG